MRFPLGQGLPGAVWEHGVPHIVEDLRNSSSFMRAAAARECGVQSGLGIPSFCGGRVQHVLTFLSAESTPLARAFEIWVPDHRGSLQLKESFYAEGLDALRSESAGVGPGAEIAGSVFAAGIPRAVDFGAPGRTMQRAQSMQALGLSFAVGLPVHDGERLRAVVVMFR